LRQVYEGLCKSAHKTTQIVSILDYMCPEPTLSPSLHNLVEAINHNWHNTVQTVLHDEV